MGLLNFFSKKKPESSEKDNGAKYFNSNGGPSSYYRGSGTDRLRSDWITGSMADTTPPTHELTTLRNRSRDLVRNDPVANAIVEMFVSGVIGTGLTLQSTLKAEDLGVSKEKAAKIRTAIERAFRRWNKEADKAGILNFDEYQRLAYRKTIVDGETIVIPSFVEEPYRTFGRCLQMFESEELDYDYVPNKRTANGITFNQSTGAPETYWIRKYKKRQWGGKNSAEPPIGIRARDKAGRPNILHVFESNRPNQTRGIPMLAPVLDKFEELNQYLEAEIVSARVSACLSIFVQKTDPMTAAQAMSDDFDAYGGRIQDIEPGVINYLSPGETINVVDPKRNESLGAFVETVLRVIGMSFGIPYEVMVKDFSKSNYSSARAAVVEAHKQFETKRAWFAKKFCQPIFELVLEEAYLRGEIPITRMQYEEKFHMLKEANWVGPSWVELDPKKEAEASILKLQSGLTTYSHELSTHGKDWEQMFEQAAREKEMQDQLGLEFTLSTKVPKEPQSNGGDNANSQEEREAE